MVNRVWQWHFGEGLVTTPSDFGLRSDPPTHPELLDYLAASSSPAAGRSSRCTGGSCSRAPTSKRATTGPSELERDPENRLVWRFNRQRLDFESMRDSLLAVSGALDPRIGGPADADHRAAVLARGARSTASSTARTSTACIAPSTSPCPDATSPRRFVTTVPQQALFLMNSPFLHEQARRLRPWSDRTAWRVRSAASGSLADPAEGVRQLYRRVLGRPPEPDELALAIEFVRRQPATNAAEIGGWKAVTDRQWRAAPLAVGAVRPGVDVDQRVHVRGLSRLDVAAAAQMGPRAAVEVHLDAAPLTSTGRRHRHPSRLALRSGMGMGALALGSLMAEAGCWAASLPAPSRGNARWAVHSSISANNPLLPKAPPLRAGQAGRPPVHERRPVARRYLRPQAGCWTGIHGKPVPDEPAHRAQDRRGNGVAVQVPEVRPERHRGQRPVRRTPRR